MFNNKIVKIIKWNLNNNVYKKVNDLFTYFRVGEFETAHHARAGSGHDGELVKVSVYRAASPAHIPAGAVRR